MYLIYFKKIFINQSKYIIIVYSIILILSLKDYNGVHLQL